MKPMKIYPFIAFWVLWFLPLSVWAEQPKTPLAYLNAMTKAHQTLNYEQLYTLQQGENTDALRYRHAYWNGREYAQLLLLDGAREEMILRDNTVSYFGDFQPFRLQSRHILDNLPSVLYADFDKLKEYTFIDAGRTRVADRIARIIRIVAKDDFRYQYTLWIDEENYLLLRSDLTDRNNQVLEQFRVIQSIVDEQFLYIVEPITSLILPTLISTEAQTPHLLTWQPTWLPSGFNEIASGRQSLSEFFIDDEQIESQLYSDGLFTFTVYLVENRGIIFNEQFWRDGKISIYSQTVGDKDIVVVGEIPLVSARYIVQELSHKVQAEN
ncbi:MucB/RseB C-terminal domain-containing protein [Glaesserella sp.]|uniref:MucB/RseB C-terminal domain-containing protein n=2 Tax=Glaesserella sp. TaxID=2094731 RepID=UPI0035A0A5BC